MVKKIAVGLVSVVIVIVLLGMALPSKWQVQRSVITNANPAVIFPLIANLKTGWPRWSAFDAEDPSLQYTYAGPDTGAGASRSWTSKKMGTGTQTITTADPNTGVRFVLMMSNGFKINGEISVQPSAQGTWVAWTDHGVVSWNPLHRWMARSLDKKMGPMFEKSLLTLKREAESARPVSPAKAAPRKAKKSNHKHR